MGILDAYDKDELSPDFMEKLNSNTYLEGLEEKPRIETAPQRLTLDNLILDTKVLEAIFTNTKVLEVALENPAVIEIINSILRSKANTAEMDASMVSEKNEDTNEEQEDTFDTSLKSSGDESTAIINTNSNADVTPNSDTAKTNKTNSEPNRGNKVTIPKINTDEVYSIYEIVAAFTELVHDDVLRTKFTKEEIIWLREAKAVLNSSFKSLVDLNRYFAVYVKSLKDDIHHPDKHSNLVIPNLRDYIVLSLIYVFEKPEMYVTNLSWDVFKQSKDFPAQYFTLQTFLKTISK